MAADERSTSWVIRYVGQGLLGLAVFAGGCSGDDVEVSTYPGDTSAALRTRCEEENAGARECEGTCILAQLNLECAMAAELDGLEERRSYLDCRDACAVVRTCPEGRRFFDCDCAVRCAEARSQRLQDLLAFHADCERQSAGPTCR